MMDPRTDNLVDLKGHCLLCYRDRASVGNGSLLGQNDTLKNSSFQDCPDENLGKLFIKLLGRQLNLPLAKLTVILDETIDSTPQTISKRWEDLINGGFCSRCYPMAKSFCDLVFKLDILKLNLNSLMSEMKDHMVVTDRDSDSTESKTMLAAKWAEDGTDSQQMFKLLDKFRGNTIAKAAKLKVLPPVLKLKRLSDSACLQYTARFNEPSGNLKEERRESLAEDSGVSSPFSMRSQEEINPQSFPFLPTSGAAACSVNDAPTTKEFKVMRRVFTCRTCSKKYFSREKYKEHCATHPPIPVKTPTAAATASTSSTASGGVKIKKLTYICPEKDCGTKFLAMDLLIAHRKTAHPSLPLLSKPTDEPTKITEENMPVLTTNDEAKKRKKYMKRSHECDFENCRKKFHSVEQLQFHSQFHLSHPCSFCGIVCKNPKALATHELKSHSDEGSSTFKDVKCPRCSNVTTNFMSYLTHFYSHLDTQASLKCLKCDASFSSSYTLRQHSLRCNNKSSTATSPEDNAAVNETETIITNQEIPTEAEKSQDYICNICSLPFYSFLALHTHLIESHDPDILSCNECERVFQNKDSYDKHKAIIHLKFKISRKYCEECKEHKTFRSVGEFNEHINQHKLNKEAKKRHTETLQECSLCQLKVTDLVAHMQIHAGNESESSSLPESSENGDENRNASNGAHYNQQDAMNGDGPTVSSLAERVRQRQLDSDDVFLGEGERRKKKKKRRKRENDLESEPAKKKRKEDNNQSPAPVESQPETDNVVDQQQHYHEESVLVNKVVSQRIPLKGELMSPQIQPPLLSPPIVQNEASCESDSTVMLPKASQVPASEVTIPEKQPEVVIKTEPAEVDIARRLNKWFEERNASNSTIELLDTDEEEVEQKPIITNVLLSQRVSSWLSDRQSIQVLPTPERPEPREEDIITID